MPKVSQMQGVPAHLETLKSDGIKRHPAWCKFAEGKRSERTCKNKKCPIYLTHCSSAAKCQYYEKNDG